MNDNAHEIYWDHRYYRVWLVVTSVIVISGFTVLVGEREMHAWSNVSFKVYLFNEKK